nr:hypothetical protein OG999_44575 [Streptomyces sp. NBC_00886]
MVTVLVSHGAGAADAAGVTMPTIAAARTAAIPARFHIVITFSLRRMPLAAASERARPPVREGFPCHSKRRVLPTDVQEGADSTGSALPSEAFNLH